MKAFTPISNFNVPIFSGDQGMPNPGAGVDKVIYKEVFPFNDVKLKQLNLWEEKISNSSQTKQFHNKILALQRVHLNISFTCG